MFILNGNYFFFNSNSLSLPLEVFLQFGSWHCHWKMKIGLLAYLFMRQSCISGGKRTTLSDLVYASIVCVVWPRSEKTRGDQRPETRHRGNELRLLHVSSHGTCHSSIRLFLKNPPENRPTSQSVSLTGSSALLCSSVPLGPL